MSEEKEVTVVVQNGSAGFTCGLIGLICSIVGIFALAILFMPLGLILGIVAIVKKSYVIGTAAVVVALIAFFLSPALMLAFI